jgi:hypothetical protein
MVNKTSGSIVVFFLAVFFVQALQAQSLLTKPVNITANRQRIADVLEIVANQGNFYFSYNSNIIKRDSLVSISGEQRTVQSILNALFSSEFEFKETGNYIIIRRAPLKLTLTTEQSQTNNNVYLVSGYITDDLTGEKIVAASVYEKQRLVAALSNEQGYFSLKLKTKYKSAAISVSKEFYEDTTVLVRTGYNQQLSVTLMPSTINGTMVIAGAPLRNAPDSIYISIPQPDSSTTLYLYKKFDSITVQRTALGNFLLSQRLKLQSINLNKFFTARPVQVSFTPGLSTNGKMNAQVKNNFSLNVLGGYAGGVNGMELGGLFNLDKKSVKYLQIAGLFNIVGGAVTGLQIAGINNTVLDSVNGVQLAGYYNHVMADMHGLQVSGGVNFTLKKTTGVQVAGTGNISGVVDGVQIAGLFNFTKKLHGVQIGLVNIADSSDGYSIGLINVILKGYHKLSVSANELTPLNLAFKTGNSKLYSILLAGADFNKEKLYHFGYGLGRVVPLNKAFSLMPELTSHYLYTGNWDNVNVLNRFSLNLELKLSKYFAIYAAPAFNTYYSNQQEAIAGYRFPVHRNGNTINFSNQLKGWFGWNLGVHIF